MNVRRKAVRIDHLIDGAGWRIRTPLQEPRRRKERRVASAIERNGLIQTVICDAKTTANHKTTAEIVSHELLGTPSKTKLGRKIVLLRRIQSAADANSY